MLIVFDLDHTLLNVNSSVRFGKYLYKKRFISTLQILRLLKYYAQHKFFGTCASHLQKKALKIFSGFSLNQLKSLIEEFLDEKLESMINTKIYQFLKEAKESGCITAIVSNSPQEIVSSIGRRLGVSISKGVEVNVDDQCTLLSDFETMIGPAKRRYVLEQAEKLQIPIDQITALTDSYLDVELLRAVGTPIAVNPDRSLKWESQMKGWTVLLT